jgi:hypothetical protein
MQLHYFNVDGVERITAIQGTYAKTFERIDGDVARKKASVTYVCHDLIERLKQQTIVDAILPFTGVLERVDEALNEVDIYGLRCGVSMDYVWVQAKYFLYPLDGVYAICKRVRGKNGQQPLIIVRTFKTTSSACLWCKKRGIILEN